MPDDGDYRSQFDRFSQDEYLRMLLNSDPDAIIPTLFLDLMNRVNVIEGKAGLVLAEVERADDESANVDGSFVSVNTVKVLGCAVDMSNILKALMEYYEITFGDDDIE